MTIDILLATYNGERYLRQQLDSILAQTNTEWRLIVRDDGSTDGTKAILTEYATKIERRYGRGRFVELTGESQPNTTHGPDKWTKKKTRVVRNFSALMEWSKNDCKADYVMFSDQDDKWRPDKIDKTLTDMHRLERAHGKTIPLLVHTDVRLVHKSGNKMYYSRKHLHRQRPTEHSLKNALVQNVVQGCTAMMNRRLLELAAPIPESARMHDMWVALIASAAGETAYLEDQTMDYRQHDNNVVAGRHNRRFSVVRNRVGTALGANIEQARTVAERVGGQMPEDRRSIVNRFFEITSHSQPLCGIMLLAEGYHRIPIAEVLPLFGGKR